MMELIQFFFKESVRNKTGKISLINILRHNCRRVGCFILPSTDGGTNSCPTKLQQSPLFTESTPYDSTSIILCCAMTENTRSSSSCAEISLRQHKDERVKKYPNNVLSMIRKPFMCDVAVQAPDDCPEKCTRSLSTHSEDMNQGNNYRCKEILDKAPHMGSTVQSAMESGSCTQSAQSSSDQFEMGEPSSRNEAILSNKDCSFQALKLHSDASKRQKEKSLPARQRLLTQCHSADNLLPTSVLSDSSESTPEVPPRRKKRSSSHETMLSSKPRPLSVGGDAHGINKTREQDKREADGGVVQFSASTENLARQSLLAAQLLHLIPARKARERNYLHGRIAANSLLGTVELERVLPSRSVQIFVGTWNMNGQAPPSELNDLLLPEDLEHVPDILAFGTQESFPERFEWEVGIQETIGPSHVLLHSAALGTLHLAVFVRRDLIWFCSVAEEASFSVRPGTAFRTKGAVAIAFMLFGTSFLFVTSHLTAHAEKVKERLSDVKKIIRSLDLPKSLPCRHKNKDVTQNFDCIFWCGDLNFRLSQPRDEVVDWVENQQFPLLAPHKMEMDQLKNSISQGVVFRGFEEGPITFKPTYKYDPGTQMFDSSQKQRTPSYTDRILFKCRHTPRRASSILGSLPVTTPSGAPFLECLKYYSVQSVCTSDHKPVWGLFRSHIRPGIDTIPLAAGLFNREVYIEGINRRAAAMDKRDGSSTVCTIQ